LKSEQLQTKFLQTMSEGFNHFQWYLITNAMLIVLTKRDGFFVRTALRGTRRAAPPTTPLSDRLRQSQAESGPPPESPASLPLCPSRPLSPASDRPLAGPCFGPCQPDSTETESRYAVASCHELLHPRPSTTAAATGSSMSTVAPVHTLHRTDGCIDRYTDRESCAPASTRP
jgi:hypothetical protein